MTTDPLVLRARVVKAPLLKGWDTDEGWEAFQHRYAHDGVHEEVSIGSASAELIAREMSLDVEAPLLDLDRYTGGRFREKAEGPGGNRLGVLGEIITYLRARRIGLDVVYVVTTRHPAGRGRYPQPDFLVRGAQTRVIETKTSEAVDYQKQLRKRWLEPCTRIPGMRAQALDQISPPSLNYELALQSGEFVPFPASSGSVHAVLVRDGRIEQLQKVKASQKWTRPQCRKAGKKRDCLDCLTTQNAPADLTIVELDNAPGSLRLLGEGEMGDAWFHAYRAWERALWLRDPPSVVAASESLMAASAAWARQVRGITRPEAVEDVWRRTCEWAEWMRGVREEPPTAHTRDEERDFTREPSPRSIDLEVLPRYLGGSRGAWERYSVRVPQRRQLPGSPVLTLEIHDQVLRVRYAPRGWPKRRAQDAESAALITRELLKDLVDPSTGGPMPESPEMERLAATVGGDDVFLGWELSRRHSWWPGPWWFGTRLRDIGFWITDCCPPELQVTPDGRALLQARLQ